MSEARGRFVWYELLTTDSAAATAFYEAVMGWTIKESGMTDRDYAILSVGERGIGGLMTLPLLARAVGARPGWVGYIGVEDVDAVAKRVKAAGGSIHRAPETIPGVGRFAMVADPQGALFVPFAPARRDEAPVPPPRGTPGHVGWHELHAADREAAFGLYAEWFGWTKDGAVDMGPMGLYQLFAIDGQQAGGMMKKTEAFRSAAWIYYFNVDEIEAAVGRVKAAGGRVINGPQEVPGGNRVAQCLDPQGAMFALVGPGG